MHEVRLDERRLGQYLIRLGKATPEQVAGALELQVDLPFMRLGEILMGTGEITFQELAEALYHQQSEALLGEVLVRRRAIRPQDLTDALVAQAAPGEGRLLGQILVESGVISAHALAEAIAERDLARAYRRFGSLHALAKIPAATSDEGPEFAPQLASATAPAAKVPAEAGKATARPRKRR